MLAEPKKPSSGWAVWMAAVIALPILYALSAGPICWLENRQLLGRPVRDILWEIYGPWRAVFGPKAPLDSIGWQYVRLFQQPDPAAPALPPPASP